MSLKLALRAASVPTIVFLTSLAVILGCDSKPNRSQRRDTARLCFNSFVTHHADAVNLWNASTSARDSASRRDLLQKCGKVLDDIRPFEPLGVEPALAEAISGVQVAFKKKVEVALANLDTWLPDRAAAEHAARAYEGADATLNAAVNRVAADLGGLKFTGHD